MASALQVQQALATADVLRSIAHYFPPCYQVWVLGLVCKRWREILRVANASVPLTGLRDELAAMGPLYSRLDQVWAKRNMKWMRSPPEELHVEQGSIEWLNARRIITASSAAEKTGVSVHKGPTLVLWANCNGIKQESTAATQAGHANEGPVAWRGFTIIFPQGTPRRYRRMKLVGMWLMPRLREWLSASPDRVLKTHPANKRRPVTLEVKYSDKTLYGRPKVEYLLQCVIQMLHVDADWMFLVYGYKQNSAAVFLIEFSQPLIDWIMPRAKEFRDLVKRGALSGLHQPPKSAFNFKHITEDIAHETERVWNGYGISREFREKHGHDAGNTILPPQPRWQLVGYFVDPTDENVNGYAKKVMRRDPVYGGVSPEVFKEALGDLWERFGVSITALNMPLHSLEYERSSLLDDCVVARKRKLVTDEGEAREWESLVKNARYNESSTRLEFDQDAIIDILGMLTPDRWGWMTSAINNYAPGMIDAINAAMCIDGQPQDPLKIE